MSAGELAASMNSIGRRRWSFWPGSRSEAPAWDGRHALEVEGLWKNYGRRKQVLAGLDLKVPMGSAYALLGKNSAGKSTLLRLAVGLARPDRGSLRLLGLDPLRHGPAVLERIGYVPETPLACEALRVRELLDFLRPFYPKRWDAEHCSRLLRRFELPTGTRLRDLSRGMQTKASLVCALAHRPDVLVLDDPTLGLDAMVLAEFLETLREAAREGTTLLIASHHLDELERLATHVGFLDQGRLLYSGPLEGLRQSLHVEGAPPSLKQIFVELLKKVRD